MSEKEQSEEKGPVATIMREIALTGLATFFMTEESVKKYLKEKKFPREIANNLLDNMGKRKEDFYKVLAKEIGSILVKSDLEKAISNFLEKHEVKISFSKKATGASNERHS